MWKKKRIALGLIGSLAMAALLAVFWPHDANYYYQRGQDRLLVTDEDGGGADEAGALSDFNRAIKLDPTFADAYRARAGLEESNLALADLTQAIELAPTNTLNYEARAWFFEKSENYPQALANLTKAIEVAPNNDVLYQRRAHLRYKMGNFSGMVADLERAGEVVHMDTNDLGLKLSQYAGNTGQLLDRLVRMHDRAIEESTNDYWGYYHRGVLSALANDFDAARQDFRRCQQFPDAKLRDYATIQVWLIQSRSGKDPNADRQLADYFGARLDDSNPDWEARIALFLLGRIDEAQFSTAASSPGSEVMRSQFWYYAAMKQLIAGNKSQAADDFQKSRLTGSRPYEVAISSQVELSRLH